MDTKPKTKALKQAQSGKIIGVPLNGEELKRFLAQKPQHVRPEGTWGRQLILERLEQLEKANGKGR